MESHYPLFTDRFLALKEQTLTLHRCSGDSRGTTRRMSANSLPWIARRIPMQRAKRKLRD